MLPDLRTSNSVLHTYKCANILTYCGHKGALKAALYVARHQRRLPDIGVTYDQNLEDLLEVFLLLFCVYVHVSHTGMYFTTCTMRLPLAENCACAAPSFVGGVGEQIGILYNFITHQIQKQV